MNEMDYKDFVKMYSLTDLLGVGSTGECYKISKTEVFKKFEYMYRVNENNPRYKMIKELTFINLEGICFPKILVKDDGILVGEVSSYARGKSIRYIEESESINKFLKSLIILESSIITLSKKHKIELKDIHGGNIIYGDNLSIIDTDEYCYNYFNNLLLFDNFHAFNSSIIMYLLNTNVFMDFHNNADKVLDNNMNDLYIETIFLGLHSFSTYLLEYINYLENKIDMEINNVGDLRNGTKKLINKS